jgi:recombinational DNA repair ATPase RecF
MPENGYVTKADLQQFKIDIVSEIVREIGGYIDRRIQESDASMREYIDERTHDVETRLLRAFADYQHAQNTRFRHMKADLGNLNTASDERLAGLEERVTNIEKRLIEKQI